MNRDAKLNEIADELKEYVAAHIATIPQKNFVRTWETKWAEHTAENIIRAAEYEAEKAFDAALPELIADAKQDIDYDLDFGFFYKES